MSGKPDNRHALIGSAILGALQDGTRECLSHSRNEATYQAPVALPRTGHRMDIAHLTMPMLALVARLNDQSSYDLVSAQLPDGQAAVLIIQVGHHPLPKGGQRSTASRQEKFEDPPGSGRFIKRASLVGRQYMQGLVEHPKDPNKRITRYERSNS